MSDAMDSDVREVIRRRVELRERDGHERLLLIKAEMGDPSRHYIMDGWLVIDTGKHTCGTGPGGHYGAHEPGCGLEQALRLDNLPGWPGDERDRLRATALESGPLPEGWERATHVKAQEPYIRYDHITGNLYRPDGSQIDVSEWPRQVVIRGPWREGRHE